MTFLKTVKKIAHLPIVGIVVTISPNFSLYKIVVLPAASNPTINILISFLPKRPLNKFANTFPIVIAYNFNTSAERIQRYQYVFLRILYVNLIIEQRMDISRKDIKG